MITNPIVIRLTDDELQRLEAYTEAMNVMMAGHKSLSFHAKLLIIGALELGIQELEWQVAEAGEEIMP